MVETSRLTSLDDALDATLDALDTRAVRRRLRPLTSGVGPRVTIGNRSFVQLCSNDYLGLANHPKVTQAASDALLEYGSGAGSARLVVGTSPPHVALEAAIAKLKRTESALVLSSGYQANTGIIPALSGPGDVIFSDTLNHASIIDGCRLSRARVEVYGHCDVNHLESLLASASNARRRFIVTETVFAMDGDLAPLRDLVSVAKRHNALLVVDEAHATGVFGPTGAGLVEEYELWGSVDVQIGTLSKAVGALGGFVAGSQALIDTIINSARTFVFTTALPPSIAAAARAAIGIIADEPALRTQLWTHTSFLRQKLGSAGYTLERAESPILPIIVGEAASAVALSDALFECGVLVLPIRPPTVPDGTARLRVTAMATHTEDDLNIAVEAFVAAGHATGQI